MNLQRTARVKDLLALFTILLLVLWFGGEMIWGDKVPFFRDLGPYFYPRRFGLANSLRAGELPLWERHSAMGFPLLADFQSGAFYPPHFLLLMLPFFSALGAIFLLHYLVAATGAYCLCRKWGHAPALALIGAVLFTLGGTPVSLTKLLNHFQAAVWLPWVLLFGERCLKAQSWRSFLALTAILLLQFLAGSPEIFVMSGAILFLDGFRLKGDDPAISLGKVFFLFGAASLLVLALGMVQILPTMELIQESRARRSIAFAEATAWSLHPLQLINLFFPDKQIELGIAPPLRAFFSVKIPFLISHYLGALSPLAISCWFYYAARRERIILSVLIVISLLLAVGDYTPLYSAVLRYVPFFSLFRFPAKFFFITYALLIFAVLRGLSCFLAPGRSGKAPLSIVTAIFFIFFIPYLYFRLDSRPLLHFIVWTKGGGLTTSTLEISTWVLSRLEVQMALTFCLFVLLVVKKFGLLRESFLSALLVTIVCVDLGSAHRPLQFLMKPDFVTRSPTILGAPEREPTRLFYTPAGSNLHPSEFFTTRDLSFSQFNSLIFGNLLPDTGVFHGFDTMQEIDALGRWPYATFLYSANNMPAPALYRVLGVLNVKYIVSFFPREKTGLTLVRHFPQYPSWLYRIEPTVPRAYVVNRATEERDPWKVLERLSSEHFKPLKDVLLDGRVEITPADAFKGEAKIDAYQNQAVTIRASLNAPGILVLADSYYPGWRAYVDGKDERIYRANLFFRAVKLAAGAHRVEFRYEPWSFRLGLMISLATFGALLVVSGVLFYKRKKSAVAVT